MKSLGFASLFLFGAFLFLQVCGQTTESSTSTNVVSTQSSNATSSPTAETSTATSPNNVNSSTRTSVTTATTNATSKSTTTTSLPTTTRVELPVANTLRVFWVTLGMEIPITQKLNDTAFMRAIEDRLLELVSKANDQASTQARRRKRAAVSGNLAVQLVKLTRDGDSKKVNAVFYSQQNGEYVPAATVSTNLNKLTKQEASIIMKFPVTTSASIVDTTSGAIVTDQRVWIIGAVLGTLGAVVIIVWLVLFIYARCLRPQPTTSLLDVEAPVGSEFKMPYQDDPTGPNGVYTRSHTVRTTSSRNGTLPVKSGAPTQNYDDDEETTNLDFDLLADEVVRRLDRKMNRIVDHKLDARTESMRDARRMTIPSPSEDSVPEESTSEARTYEPKAKPRKGRRRKSKMNSVTPSDDDSSLPPLRKPHRYEEAEEDPDEQRRRHKARQRAARDLDRALGIDEQQPRKRKSKSKHRKKKERRSEDEEEAEENATLERARERMSDLISDPYTVGDSTREDSIQAEGARLQNREPTGHPDGELLQPTRAGDSGHQPIRVMTSLRPDALKVAALTSTYSTGDELEKIRPQVEKDLRSQPAVSLDMRGPTPVFSKAPASRESATPVGAFRPVASASVPRPPGQPLAPNADEADLVSDLPGAEKGSTSPQPIIDSIREELKRLTARSEA